MRAKYEALYLISLVLAGLTIASIFIIYYINLPKKESATIVGGKEVYLPYPRLKGKVSLEEAIARRRSIREYLNKPITIEQLAQILWAAQGITDIKRSFRVAPSAGATYPLILYVVVGEKGVLLSENKYLKAGVYKYIVKKHSLVLVKEDDVREDLAKAALNQEWVLKAPVSIVIVAIYERTTRFYGERGIRYVHIEVGHVGQNIYLQATALGLGTVAVGAFYDDAVRDVIGASKEEHPLYIMPIGVPKELHKITREELVKYYEANRRG